MRTLATEVKQRGLDIVIAIDTSKSMLAEDIAPNRLARAKLAALDLMQLAKADRLGLVAFAGIVFTVRKTLQLRYQPPGEIRDQGSKPFEVIEQRWVMR